MEILPILVVGLFIIIVFAIAWNVYVRSKGAEYWYIKAESEHFITKNNSRALTYIDRALSIDPKNKEYIFLKSHLLHRLERHEEAREWEAKVNAP